MARKLDDLQIWVSPLTNEIFAGYLSKGKQVTIATQKVNVTDQVMATVMQRLNQETEDGTGMEYKCVVGTLTWKRTVKGA